MGRLNESTTISIPIGQNVIQGDLLLPADAKGAVIFAHGSGSSRHSPRNKYVATVLNDGGIATLLIDLLTRDEEVVDLQTSYLRFNIDLLAERLSVVTDWVRGHPPTKRLHVGYFGAS